MREGRESKWRERRKKREGKRKSVNSERPIRKEK